MGDVPRTFPLQTDVKYMQDGLAVEEGRLREKISIDLISAGTPNDVPHSTKQWHHCKLVKGPLKTHYTFTYENEDTFALSAKRVNDDFYISSYRLFPAAVNTHLEEDESPKCQYIAVLKKVDYPQYTWKLILTANCSAGKNLDDQGGFEIATVTHGIRRLEEAKADIRTLKVSIPTLVTEDFSGRRSGGEDMGTTPTDIFGEAIDTNEHDEDERQANEKADYSMDIARGLSGTSIWACYPNDPILHGQKATLNCCKQNRNKAMGASVASKKETQTLIRLQNKCPVWNPDVGSLVLRFDRGRVQRASAKNFLLCESGSIDKAASEAVLQFGKTKRSTYSLDYKYPMSPLQALGISLSTFAWASELKG